MKLFVSALLVLALIAGFCIWGTLASTAIVDEILGELHRAPVDRDTVPANAHEVSEKNSGDNTSKMIVILLRIIIK